MKKTMNNKGFIATAVLYSLIILLSMSLFIIARNIATIRDVQKETTGDIKDDFNICDPESRVPVDTAATIPNDYALALELRGNYTTLVSQDYTFFPCRIYYIEIAGGQGGADTYQGGFGGYQFFSLRTTNSVTAKLYAGGRGQWNNGGRPDGHLGISSGGGGGTSSVWIGNTLLAAAGGGGGGGLHSKGGIGYALRGSSTAATYSNFAHSHNATNGKSYSDGDAHDKDSVIYFFNRYGYPLPSSLNSFNAIENSWADGGGGGGGFPAGTNHYFHVSYFYNAFWNTDGAGDEGGSGGYGYNYLQSTGNSKIGNLTLLKYNGINGCNGRDGSTIGSCSLGNASSTDDDFNGYIRIYAKKGSF